MEDSDPRIGTTCECAEFCYTQSKVSNDDSKWKAAQPAVTNDGTRITCKCSEIYSGADKTKDFCAIEQFKSCPIRPTFCDTSKSSESKPSDSIFYQLLSNSGNGQSNKLNSASLSEFQKKTEEYLEERGEKFAKAIAKYLHLSQSEMDDGLYTKGSWVNGISGMNAFNA